MSGAGRGERGVELYVGEGDRGRCILRGRSGAPYFLWNERGNHVLLGRVPLPPRDCGKRGAGLCVLRVEKAAILYVGGQRAISYAGGAGHFICTERGAVPYVYGAARCTLCEESRAPLYLTRGGGALYHTWVEWDVESHVGRSGRCTSFGKSGALHFTWGEQGAAFDVVRAGHCI